MLKKLVLAVMALLLTVSAAALAMPADTAQTVVIHEQDNGQTVKIRQFDTLQVSLRGNPTTGYIWQVTAVNPEILTFQEHKYTPDSLKLAGSGGTDLFSFKAQNPGYCQLSLVYRRPFEANPIGLFSVMVEITDYTTGQTG